jgi:hypothetical protein
MTVTRRCETCGTEIFSGEAQEYRDEAGLVQDDGYDGHYYPGCGVCEKCGRELCATCGQFDSEGVCRDCQDTGGNDDDDEDL